ncbi:MAG: 16S rRNA (cytosine(967)-C(5))-methyltransferase RsmB [Proteobacteria bacterium]|nr:16S rRNA (cytosine(967)-C(5))-methyltransferase RsmB [Pseudomonadota bacterium]
MTEPTAKPAKGQQVNVRLDTARALTHIIAQQRTVEWVRAERPQWLQSPLHSQLLYGTLRHYLSLGEALKRHLNRPLKDKDLDLYHVMLVGAYQLKHTAIAEYAAISECVNGCTPLGKPWARGLVNGVLRAMQRDGTRNPDPATVAVLDHPQWLRELLAKQYRAQADGLMAANNLRAPMTVRINQSRVTTEAFKQQLDTAGIDYLQGPWSEALTLDQPQLASLLPGWDQGACSVQDLSAQHAAHLMLEALQANTSAPVNILDACAAPGGKLFHLREALAQTGIAHRLFALDNKEKRLHDVEAIGARLGHATYRYQPKLGFTGQAQANEAIGLLCIDGCSPNLPFNAPFDAILLDAPCSGSGTIRRNPDIRLLITQASLLEQQDLQLRLLQNLWQHLVAGGTLVYSTCSVFAEENDQVMHSFLGATRDASAQTPAQDYGQATEYGWQMLPTEPLTDGFYYCLLRKQGVQDKAAIP